MADLFDDFDLPDSAIARAACAFARDIESVAIFRHSVRSYLYARALGEARQLRPGQDFDDELLFLGAVLHDVGLSEPGNGDQRFEVDGADLAAKFLLDRGVPPDRVGIVWDAIALHTSVGINNRKRPEIALAAAGISTDTVGTHAAELPAGLADQVHAALPRLNVARGLADAIVQQAKSNLKKAHPFTMSGVLLRQRIPDAAPPWNWDGVVAASPWGE